ncbi:MAG: hypothetical protein JSS99_06310 [Actinobacteria bacterium]|nr:hypothetical protein [Actinomycetota bacterium]
MASAGPGGAAVAVPRPRSRTDRAATSDVESAAWLWALPCALVTVALVAWLGPPLSHVLYPTTLPVLPTVEHNPEPVEDTRFLLSLLGPVLLAVSVVWLAPRLPLPRRAGAMLALGAQLLALGVVVLCFARQFGPSWRIEFFTPAQVALGLAGAVALALLARAGRLTGWRFEPRWLTWLAPLAAALLTGVWFLSYLNTAQTICSYGDCYNTAFMADETFAVLNGLTPLVNHTAAYGALWPYVFAPFMLVLGKTLFVWTLLEWALVVAMLLALYGVLRRVTRSSLAALALFLPLMAFTYYAGSRDLHNPIAIYQQVPMRTAGPFLVAWLVARRLHRGGGDAAVWPLGLAAGLAALNNVDFGLAALGATVAALLWTEPLTRARLRRLTAGFGGGLLAAYALVALVTLIRAGALPDPAKAFAFARLYTQTGVGVWPLLRLFGLPLVAYLTYAAAIGVATTRARRGAPDRTLTGMLVWSGIFGLGSAAYYMGATTILAIATLFPAWGLSLALLAVVAVRQLASRRERLPGLPALAALFGICLIATFVFMPPARFAPWTQADRIRSAPEYAPPDAEPLAPPSATPGFRRFVSATVDAHGRLVVRHGAPVAFFTATGHLLADAYGIRDVVPYTGRSVFTAQQFDEALARLRAAGGNTVIVPSLILPRVARLLVERGFRVLTRSGWRAGVPGAGIDAGDVVVMSADVYPDELTKWVDARALR